MLGGLAVLIVTSPGWPVFRDSFFDPEVFADSFPDVLKAFWLDIRIFLVVEVVVLVLGLAVALVRTVKLPALFPPACSRSSTRTSSAASRRSCSSI